MDIYGLARRLNGKRKELIKQQAGRVLSPVRRIECVCPPKNGRFVAMTFDDGPDALTPEGYSESLTGVILGALKEYGARVTFDVIGSTQDNYPDEAGELGGFTWGGIKYDHYPRFGDDSLAGAKNQPELVRAILADGHELSNHGSTHRLFGKMRAVYGSRNHFAGLGEVVDDLNDLHSYVKDNFGYTMKLARPAHYIDKMPDGATAYDAYRIMGYNYMAASFDGAGWQPRSSYEQEIREMTEPLHSALAKDPDALNGKIIFQKDGCNMAMRTPIADALPEQLKILKEYGYAVIPVSELLQMSPFEDMAPDAPEAEDVKYLLGLGHTVGYKNNTFHGERFMTSDEFYMTVCPPEALRAPKRMTKKDMVLAARQASPVKLEGKFCGNALLKAAEKAGANVDEKLYKDKTQVLRSDGVRLAAQIVRASGK